MDGKMCLEDMSGGRGAEARTGSDAGKDSLRKAEMKPPNC